MSIEKYSVPLEIQRQIQNQQETYQEKLENKVENLELPFYEVAQEKLREVAKQFPGQPELKVRWDHSAAWFDFYQLSNGDFSVKFNVFADNNDDLYDGAILIENEFVVNPQENHAKKHRQSIALLGAEDDARWQSQFKLFKNVELPSDKVLQTFTREVLSARPRPFTVAIRNILKNHSKYLEETQRQLDRSMPGWKLDFNHPQNYYARVLHEGTGVISMNITVVSPKGEAVLAFRQGFILDEALTELVQLDVKLEWDQAYAREHNLDPDFFELDQYKLPELRERVVRSVEKSNARGLHFEKEFFEKVLPTMSFGKSENWKPIPEAMNPLDLVFEANPVGFSEEQRQSALNLCVGVLRRIGQEQIRRYYLDDSDPERAWEALMREVAAQQEGRASLQDILSEGEFSEDLQPLRAALLEDKLVGELDAVLRSQDPETFYWRSLDFARHNLWDARLRGTAQWLTEQIIAVPSLVEEEQSLLSEFESEAEGSLAAQLPFLLAVAEEAQDFLLVLKDEASFAQKLPYLFPRFFDDVITVPGLAPMVFAPLAGAKWESLLLELCAEVPPARGFLIALTGLGAEAATFTTVRRPLDGRNPVLSWSDETKGAVILFSLLRGGSQGAAVVKDGMARGALGPRLGGRAAAEPVLVSGVTGRVLLQEGLSTSLTPLGTVYADSLGYVVGALMMGLATTVNLSLGLEANPKEWEKDFWSKVLIRWNQALLGVGGAYLASGGRLQSSVFDARFEAMVRVRETRASRTGEADGFAKMFLQDSEAMAEIRSRPVAPSGGRGFQTFSQLLGQVASTKPEQATPGVDSFSFYKGKAMTFPIENESPRPEPMHPEFVKDAYIAWGAAKLIKLPPVGEKVILTSLKGDPLVELSVEEAEGGRQIVIESLVDGQGSINPVKYGRTDADWAYKVYLQPWMAVTVGDVWCELKLNPSLDYVKERMENHNETFVQALDAVIREARANEVAKAGEPAREAPEDSADVDDLFSDLGEEFFAEAKPQSEVAAEAPEVSAAPAPEPAEGSPDVVDPADSGKLTSEFPKEPQSPNNTPEPQHPPRAPEVDTRSSTQFITDPAKHLNNMNHLRGYFERGITTRQDLRLVASFVEIVTNHCRGRDGRWTVDLHRDFDPLLRRLEKVPLLRQDLANMHREPLWYFLAVQPGEFSSTTAAAEFLLGNYTPQQLIRALGELGGREPKLETREDLDRALENLRTKALFEDPSLGKYMSAGQVPLEVIVFEVGYAVRHPGEAIQARKLTADYPVPLERQNTALFPAVGAEESSTDLSSSDLVCEDSGDSGD